MLEVKNLTKSFVQGQMQIKAVDDVSFSFPAGQTIAIVGPSGSGKTTLLSLLAGLERPDRGQILIGGQDITNMTESDLSHFRGEKMGIVFQQFHLMPHLSALENVQLPLDIQGTANATQRATSYLERVGLGGRLSHRPNQMSGGECQRVAIARAAVVEPTLLFADEPSGNLDLKTGKIVMDLLFDLVQEKSMSMILVTHDMELAKRCQKILRIEGGKLV